MKAQHYLLHKATIATVVQPRSLSGVAALIPAGDIIEVATGGFGQETATVSWNGGGYEVECVDLEGWASPVVKR